MQCLARWAVIQSKRVPVRSAWRLHDELRHCGALEVTRAALEAAAARTASACAGLFYRRGSRVLYRHAVGSDFRAVLAAERHSVLRADDRPPAGLVALRGRCVPGPCGGGTRRRVARAAVAGGLRHLLHGGAAERLRSPPFRG